MDYSEQSWRELDIGSPLDTTQQDLLRIIEMCREGESSHEEVQHCLDTLPVKPASDANFSASVRLTPVKLSTDVYQILASEPGIRAKALKWQYTFVYHGTWTHEWSLLRAQQSDEMYEKPVAVMNTWCKDIKTHECKVIDLINPLNAKSFTLVHFWDSYSQNGTHIGFQLDEYRFEWKRENTGFEDMYLWREDLVNKSFKRVARITAQTLFLNPINNSPLWCLELAENSGVCAHLALVTAMYLKVSHVKQHAYFAQKHAELELPVHIKALSFEGENCVYKNEDQEWEDYPNTLPKSEPESGSKCIIKTISRAYLEPYKLTPSVIKALETEMRARIKDLKSALSI